MMAGAISWKINASCLWGIMTTALDPLSHVQSDGALRVFFFTGHASVKKDARRIRRHTCRQGVKQSQDETRHPLPSREKHKPHGRSFAVWQRLRRQPIYRWEQLFPPLGLILRCNYFSLFTRWPKSACCARATAEELKLRVPWRAHGNSVYLLDFWSYQMIRAVMWTASSDIRLWEIQ